MRPYWIAKEELSNALFARYLRESGAEPPSAWVGAGFDPARGRFASDELPENFDQQRWLSLPATFMTYRELRACAEWYGFRVPRHPELEYAQRGAPLEIEFPVPGDANVDRSRVLPRMPVAEWVAAIADELEPVNSPNAGLSPFGLVHAAGNVGEWTSTLGLRPESGVLSPTVDHVVLGGAFDARTIGWDKSTHPTSSPARGSVQPTIGLRMARSDSPPQ